MNTPAEKLPSYKEAFWVWVKIALLSFGGPAGQIAVMHRILVEEKKWISENRFLHALNYCMLLPGPEAQQLATYIGWLLHRSLGGMTAGLLFVLPGFLSILALSIIYALYQQTFFIAALFFGLKAAVLAVVVSAVIRIGQKALKNNVMMAIAFLSFTAIFFFNAPFPFIILIAGVTGFIGYKMNPDKFYIIKGHDVVDESVLADNTAVHIHPTAGRFIRVAGLWLMVWSVPIILVYVFLGKDHVFMKEAIFFSKAAVVTFGGAYSVLAYIAQEAVHTYHWLKPGEMLDGLGMAETTPGPLIMVVQFVGFMGAFRNPGVMSSMTAGILGSIITVWVTFAPCFLWIFLGAPYIERLRGNHYLNSALSAITACVVGVILNLAVWFSLHVIFDTVTEKSYGFLKLTIPQWSTVDIASLIISATAFILLLRFKLNMILVLMLSTVAGSVYYFLAF